MLSSPLLLSRDRSRRFCLVLPDLRGGGRFRILALYLRVVRRLRSRQNARQQYDCQKTFSHKFPRGSRIEDRGSKIQDKKDNAILYPRSSILYTRSSMPVFLEQLIKQRRIFVAAV